MKKLFLTMLAAVTLLASCSKEETPGQINGEESLVTFTLSTDQLATKAVGDGTTANKLYYAVYDASGTMVSQISKTTSPQDINNLKSNVTFSLLNGEEYSIIFWAQSENASCVIAWDTKTMTYAPTLANQESYDAFFAYVPKFKVTGDKTESVKLTRPFAQLNIATTEGDLAELKGYYNVGDFTKAKVTVSKLPNVLDLVSGVASGDEVVTFDNASIDLLKNETFPVVGYKQYLAMNYVLVSDAATVDVTLDIATANDEKTVSRSFANVPVKRNYRTNIYGDLYASTFNYEVVVTPDFETPHYNIFSGVVNLSQDMTTNKSYVVADNDEAIINLGDFDFVNNSNSSELEEGDGIIVYGKLTINGNGTVEAPTRAIWARGNTGAEVNIYGGNYVGSQDGNSSVIYASGDGVVNIYGGVFEAKIADKTSYANKTEGVYAALNVQDNQGTINVYGGTFINFDPVNPGTELASWNEAHPNGFVADGYVSVEIEEGVFVVVKEGSTSRSITMGTDLNLFSSLKVTALDGGNNTLKSTAQKAVVSNGGSIKNVTLNGGADYAKDKDGNYLLNSEGSKLSTRAIWLEKATSDVVIENVAVRDAGYAFNTGSGIGDNLKLTVSNSTFENWMSYDGFASASFSNCNFEVGSYFEQGSEFNGGMRPYVETIFENCNFESGFKVDSYCVVNEGKSNERVVNPKLTFKNCKYNGVLLTSSNISELLFADDQGTSNNVIVQ